MKRNITLLLIAIAILFSASVYAGTPIAETELPKTARAFLAKHFPGDKVLKAEKDQGRRGMEYDVDLQSGAEVDFTDNGDWKDVKAARGASVPAAVVPSAISAYVATNFKGQRIVEISRKRGGYEVELSNGSELKLTEDAKPMPVRQGNRGKR